MTNPPYAPGPGRAFEPGRPQPPQPGPTPPTFQYRPADPYGHLASAAQLAGPVLPPPPTFGERWGITGTAERPRQVTWLLQLLWIYQAAAVLAILLSLIPALVVSMVFSSFGMFAGVGVGFIVLVAGFVLIWAVAKDGLGRFGFENPRMVLYIGLGLLGLNSMCSFVGFLKFLPAIVQVAAVLLCTVLLFTRTVREWLQSRLGNRQGKVPDRPPTAGGPLAGPPRQPL